MESKYKLLVLADINKSTGNILKSAIGLAKKINADISLFHVKKPTDVVKQDNQLSAVRAINNDYNITDKRIKELINTMSKAYDVNISYTFVIGNIKNEISRVIEKSQPDIIVLGKRLSKPFSFIGDNITKYVLKRHNGGTMIVAQNNVFEPNQELVMATLNSASSDSRLEYVKDLFNGAEKPLKSFRIVNNGAKLNDSKLKKDENTVEYVFEQGDDSIKNLSKYLTLNKIDLLFLDLRTKEFENRRGLKNLDEVIGGINVSLLVT